MKKTIGTFFVLLFLNSAFGQISKFSSYAQEMLLDNQMRVHFVNFKESHRVSEAETAEFINSMLFTDGIHHVEALKTERDDLGFTHIRFGVYQNDILLVDKSIIAHIKNGKLISLNGDLYELARAENGFTLSEKQALTFALNKVGAEKYKWTNKAEEQHMREVLNDPSFTYYPHGHKTIIEKDGKLYSAFRFNIYAETPLYRANVFVNAANGQILAEHNLICDADVPGTAVTKYSGTQTITCDQAGPEYRLLESGRGLGIETYNLKNLTTYANNNFTNTTTSWTVTNIDQGATDAHWGAEKTYDYFLSQHNRNSINNAGFKLISYVHYGSNYANAFWDGNRMTYGDGNGGSLRIFSALDVCGHEVSHGLTSNSAQLIYQGESGALNESYSDIFGACIENFARPGNWNWKIGEDITSNNNGLRNMSLPNAYNDPDTYGGSFWFTGTGDNGGVHTNSGVSNYWFYLLTTGGSGVNDLSNTYSVQAIGMTAAARIAFRALTVYYTQTTNYATARNLSIQAAKDLYGDCSNEVIQTINAWHAVGVGNKYIPGVISPDFAAEYTSFCTLPATVSFKNNTPYASTYFWDFGDGSTSTSTNVAHTYTSNGIYSVKLKAVGCGNVTDSITKNSLILINVPPVPTVNSYTVCENSPATLSANGNLVLKWYDSPTANQLLGVGTTITTPPLNLGATVYVANTFSNAPVSGGILTNVGGGNLANSAQWLVFDVVQSGTLNTVDVYASTAGVRNIELRNSGNVTINVVPATLTVGLNVVNLYMPLTVGNNYRLGLGVGAANLYRSNSGVSYPYYVGDCIKITNSSAGAGHYYWFYNWSVTKDDCTSPLVPVNLTYKPAPQVALTVPEGIFCKDDELLLNGTPGGGTFNGPGVSGSNFSAASLGIGTHTVFYTYTDADGCSNSESKTVEVTECTGINTVTNQLSGINVFPNPALNTITVSGLTQLMASEILISDLMGRIISSEKITSNEQNFDVSGLAKGVYLITVSDASQKVNKTIKFVKE